MFSAYSHSRPNTPPNRWSGKELGLLFSFYTSIIFFYRKLFYLIFIWISTFFTNCIQFAICSICVGIQLYRYVNWLHFSIVRNWQSSKRVVWIDKTNEYQLTWKYSTPVFFRNSAKSMNFGGLRWCSNRWSVCSLSMYQARTIFRFVR